MMQGSLMLWIVGFFFAAVLAGLNGMIVYILNDLRGWLKGLSAEFHAHTQDREAHCKK